MEAVVVVSIVALSFHQWKAKEGILWLLLLARILKVCICYTFSALVHFSSDFFRLIDHHTRLLRNESHPTV